MQMLLMHISCLGHLDRVGQRRFSEASCFCTYGYRTKSVTAACNALESNVTPGCEVEAAIGALGVLQPQQWHSQGAYL